MGREPTGQDRWEASPGLLLPRAWGLRLSITYINSGAQPGPICRPPPHLGSPRQPVRARWWLGGVAVRGGPRSPSPHLTPPPTHAPNLLFLMLLPQSFTTTKLKKKKKSDHARPRQLLGSDPCPPPPARLPRARAASLLPPAPILSPDDSHRCAGGLTAEATRPPPPSASRRETAPLHPPTLREAGPPRSKASGDHAGSGKAAALPPLGEVGPPGGAEKARRVKPPETHTSPRASSSTLHFAL